MRLPGCATRTWWAVKDLNLGRLPQGLLGLRPSAFSRLSQLPQNEIVKDLAEGRRLERLCPEGPWLSRPVGYQLPEPSRYKLQIGLQGNYRLNERHQECPTESRYERRPRLKKCRICDYFTAKDNVGQDWGASSFTFWLSWLLTGCGKSQSRVLAPRT